MSGRRYETHTDHTPFHPYTGELKVDGCTTGSPGPPEYPTCSGRVQSLYLVPDVSSITMTAQRRVGRITQLQYLLLKLVAWPLRLNKANFLERRLGEVRRMRVTRTRVNREGS